MSAFKEISKVNLARCVAWEGGELKWTAQDFGLALAGETGELCNVLKKLKRAEDGMIGNSETEKDLLEEARHEIADVFIYLDLLASRMGIDLESAIREKFNRTSEKHGFPQRL